jgi:hypothetical protein
MTTPHQDQPGMAAEGIEDLEVPADIEASITGGDAPVPITPVLKSQTNTQNSSTGNVR